MTVKPKNKWPKTELAEHYLLFGQTLLLLLNDSAFESFRAPVLGNAMRLKELRGVCDQIIHREMPHSIFNSVRDEFVKNMEDDKKAASIIGENYDEYLDLVKSANSSDYSDLGRVRNSTSLIERKLKGFYAPRILRELIITLGEPKERLKLQELTREYVTHLVNFGFDRRYIKQVTKDVFFAKDILKVGPGLLKRFFSHFLHSEKTYTVYVPIKERDAKAFKGFESFSLDLMKVKDLPGSLQKVYREGAQYSNTDHVFKHDTEAFDPYAAANAVRRLVSTYASLTALEQKGLDLTPRPYTFASLPRARTYTVIHSESSPIQPTANSISKERGRSLGKNLDSIIDNFEFNSRGRLLTALNSTALARQTTRPENQIILIWSSIETLFGDPPKGTPRIKYYRDCLLNCILLNYPWRYSEAVFNQINFHAKKILDSALDKAEVEGGIPPLRRFQHFLFDPAYSDDHRSLMTGIRENPSLTQMVFQFYRKFGTGPALRKATSEHAQRVEWQIDRIYRARNDFVHSGYKSPFVQGLAHNSFEYFRTAMQTLIYHAAQIRSEFNLEAASNIEELREAVRLQKLRRDAAIETANLKNSEEVTKFLGIFRRV